MSLLGSAGVSPDKRQLDKCVHSALEPGWDRVGVLAPNSSIGGVVGGEESVM